ncbi:MAG: choice-of-anchor Q domain-containing protein [Candidatus Promineifilaceae bacterium]
MFKRISLIILLLFSTILFLNALFFVAQAGSNILYVAPGGACSGASPCFSTIQAALDEANSDTVIKVASGNYSGVNNIPSLNRDGFTATQVIAINNTVTIQGGYTTSDWTSANPEINLTTIDAQGQGRAIYVVGQITPTISGFRITGGQAAELGGHMNGDAGGGIYVLSATLNLNDTNIFANQANTINVFSCENGNTSLSSYGGGLYIAENSHAILNNSTLTNNQAIPADYACYGGGHGIGGGIYNAGELLLNISFITTNIAQGDSDVVGGRGYGGGIYNGSSGNLTLTESSVSDNRARGMDGNLSSGGGIYNASGGKILLNDSTIDNNTADADPGFFGVANTFGGGVFNEGELNVIVSSISNNSVLGGDGGSYNPSIPDRPGGTANGGGVYNASTGIAMFSDSTVNENNATGGTGADDDGVSGFGSDGGNSYGGGFYNQGILTLVNNTFNKNNSTGGSGGGLIAFTGGDGYGGAIYNIGTLSLSKNTLDNNLAVGSGIGVINGGVGRGGGIYNTLTLFINDSTLRNNEAIGGGTGDNGGSGLGGGVFNTGTTSLVSSILNNNSAIGGNGAGFGFANNGAGGGIYNTDSLTLKNSTLSSNNAIGGDYSGSNTSAGSGSGGGIYSTGTFTIDSSTLNNNGAIAGNGGGGTISGGGIENIGTGMLVHTIIANSVSGNCSGSISSSGYNLASDNSCNLMAAGDKNNTDPLLGPLQNNGGATFTHALLSNSPAIDTGNNTVCQISDQRGAIRPGDGDGNGSFVCDIGAYEATPLPAVYLPMIIRQ